MARPFDAFVIFAEMRTGSNHLQENLNALPDVTCHGEVFNPVFIGKKDCYELLGFDMDRRERDPMGLLAAMTGGSGEIAGFRFFHDHDPRILDSVMADPRIAKVILTRNPLDSYVSRKIASATGQWRLTDLKHARTSRITFDAGEFAQMLDDWGTFRDRIRRDLQIAGQTAFHIRYEDINDVEVLNGLARFLGSRHELPAASNRLKRQNPGDLREKVENYDEMTAALAGMDHYGLDRANDGDSPRGPGVSGFVAHPEAGLLFIPVRGSPETTVLDWMAGIGDVGRDGLLTGMTQKNLRQWMRAHPGFMSFSVLRHPVARAVEAYRLLLSAGDAQDRHEILRKRYKVPFPSQGNPDREAFLAFLAFLKGNLAGQTSLKTEPEWATQTSILQGATSVVVPRLILKEGEVPTELRALSNRMTLNPAAGPPRDPVMDGGILSALYDERVERAVFDVYRRDYINFGFGAWTGE